VQVEVATGKVVSELQSRETNGPVSHSQASPKNLEGQVLTHLPLAESRKVTVPAALYPLVSEGRAVSKLQVRESGVMWPHQERSVLASQDLAPSAQGKQVRSSAKSSK
jgi:hypothetical protein